MLIVCGLGGFSFGFLFSRLLAGFYSLIRFRSFNSGTMEGFCTRSSDFIETSALRLEGKPICGSSRQDRARCEATLGELYSA